MDRTAFGHIATSNIEHWLRFFPTKTKSQYSRERELKQKNNGQKKEQWDRDTDRDDDGDGVANANLLKWRWSVLAWFHWPYIDFANVQCVPSNMCTRTSVIIIRMHFIRRYFFCSQLNSMAHRAHEQASQESSNGVVGVCRVWIIFMHFFLWNEFFFRCRFALSLTYTGSQFCVYFVCAMTLW